jgi:hypothetical protein
MEPDALFLRTLDDLERRTTSCDEYEVPLSALLLRKLLIDGRPLIDLVNESRKLRVRFRMNGETNYERVIHQDAPVFWSLEDGIDPDIPHPPGMQAPTDATRDQLLARKILRVNNMWVTVRDLIDQLAHVEGAVHSDKPENKRQEVLHQIAKSIYVGGLPAGVRQIQAISRVVLRGLTPLRQSVGSSAVC